MKFFVLASGNCVYVETKEKRILLDLGISSLQAEKKLKAKGIDPSSVDMIWITHAHVDHISGLPVFLKKYHPQVYITASIEKEANLKLSQPIYIEKEENFGNLKITAIKTSHDTEDSNGYLLEEGDSSLLYMTDTGYVNEKYHPLLKNRSAYIFESNHDVEKLMNNPHYPHQTKMRILSDRGHLSNQDSAYYLSKFIGKDTKVVILAHLSEENNTPELARQTLEQELKDHQISFSNIVIATQKEPTELLEI